MAARKTLRQEIDELRSELADIRANRDEAGRQIDQEPGEDRASDEISPETETDALTAEDVERALKDLVEATEGEITKHPMIATGAAFLLGFTIGRLSKS